MMRPLKTFIHNHYLGWLFLLAPILRFIPEYKWQVWGCALIAVLLVLFVSKFRLNKTAWWFLFISVAGLTFIGTLLSSTIFNYKLDFNLEQTVFGQKSYYLTTKQTAKDALFLPYRARDLVFNPYPGLAGETIGRALGKVLTYEWLAVFLPLGCVCFGLGLKQSLKKWPVLPAVLVGWLLAAGIQILPDTKSLFYFLTPFWLLVAYQGLPKLSSKTLILLTLSGLIYLL